MNTLQMHELEEMEGMELNEETKERFRIESNEQLNWSMRKLSALNTKQKDIEDLANAEIDRIKKWEDKEIESLSKSKEFFKGLIMKYAIEERSKDPKFKSLSLPYGKVGFRKVPEKWKYEEDKLVEYLGSVGALDLIRVKREPNKTLIKKRFKVLEDGRVLDEDGSLVDGLTVEMQEDKLDIRTND